MGLKDIWQLVRQDDNGLVYLCQGNLEEKAARKLADDFNHANDQKPHPHKQLYFAEVKQPRL
jgi:hypothetical protein